MERLTKMSNYGEVAFTFDLFINCRPSEANKILNVATKLKEYEDLEEQGRLIKLSCKVGDTIWYVDEDDDEYPIELEINTISKNDINTFTFYYADDDNYGKFAFIDSDFGETVFLTKSEAEAKLKELRGA